MPTIRPCANFRIANNPGTLSPCDLVSEMSCCDDLYGLRVIPWRAGTRQFRSDRSAIWTARQSFTISAGWTIRVYLERKLWDWGWEVVRAFRIPVGVLISIFQRRMTRTTLHRFAFCWDVARFTALLETADSDGN